MKRLQIPQKLAYEKNYVLEKTLRTRNFRRGYIKNLLPEKRKENMSNEQPRFKPRFKKVGSACVSILFFLMTMVSVNNQFKLKLSLQLLFIIQLRDLYR